MNQTCRNWKPSGIVQFVLVAASFAAMIAFLSVGCATKAYVRSQVASQVAESQTALGGRVDRVQADLNAVRKSAEEAAGRPREALEVSGDARNIALGRHGYNEVDPGELTRYAAISLGETKPIGDRNVKSDEKKIVVSLSYSSRE
jgi:hypothetical protein